MAVNFYKNHINSENNKYQLSCTANRSNSFI